MDVDVKNKSGRKALLKDEELKELIRKSQSGDQHARDTIVEKNMRQIGRAHV